MFRHNLFFLNFFRGAVNRSPDNRGSTVLGAHHILHISRIQHCSVSEVHIFVSYKSVTQREVK
jgi:hypothetical protein